MASKPPAEPVDWMRVLFPVVVFLWWVAVAVGVGLLGGQVAANLFGGR